MISIHFREYKIRTFMFSDYELMCTLYGISGASGKNKITQWEVRLV